MPGVPSGRSCSLPSLPFLFSHETSRSHEVWAKLTSTPLLPGLGQQQQARGEHPRELLSSPIPPPLKICDWAFNVHGQVLTNPRRTRICTVTTKLQQRTDNHGELLGRGGMCPSVRSICDMLRPAGSSPKQVQFLAFGSTFKLDHIFVCHSLPAVPCL